MRRLIENPADFLLRLYRAGVEAALPRNCLDDHWPEPATGRTGIIAFGKAALPMAELAAIRYGPHTRGVVVHPAGAGPGAPTDGFEYHAASHPVPCRNSVRGARAALAFAAGLNERDLLLALVSGGGSALMCLPASGVTLADKQEVNRALLRSGAPIDDINCLRQHLSRIKGGRLAAACRAPVLTLAISDTPGNDPSMIASGPTVQSTATLADARKIVARLGAFLPASARRALDKPGNESPRLDGRQETRIVACGGTALDKAAEICRDAGIEPLVLGDALQGEARDLGREHARNALELAQGGRKCCLLSGGETTVTLDGPAGRGGRNTEYALALTIALDDDSRVWALAADTDGIDGSGGHSGALGGPGTLGLARAKGVDPALALRRHASAEFFAAAGGLLNEGASGTNVNDFRAILVNP